MLLHITKLQLKILFFWSLPVLLQLIIWFSWENLLSGAITFIGGAMGLLFCCRKRLLTTYPLSSTMLIGYASYYFFLPPMATLAEFKPLTYNLKNPTLVFAHAFVCFLALLIAHLIYRKSSLLSGMRETLSAKLYRPAGFFSAPSNVHLLAMGCIGMLATIEQIFIGGGAQKELLGAGNKFIQALYPLTYLPYAILVRPVMGHHQKITSKWLFILASYTAILGVVSMGINSRAAFFMGIMSVAMVYVYAVSARILSKHMLHPKNVIIVISLFFLLSGPITDFATSMVIVRGQRSKISAIELVDKTFDTFLDKKSIRAFREKKDTNTLLWDEHYVDNLFLARMANLKFADNSISIASRFNSSHNQQMRDFEWQKALSVFPRPLLSLFDISIDKDLVSSASGGDLLLFVATRSPYVLGGFRTGSILGSGYALFAWLYPIILTGILVVVFPLADAQTSRVTMSNKDGKITWHPILNPLAIATFFTWFFFLTSAATGIESMAGFSQFIFRGWLQILLIYAVAYWSTLWILLPFKKNSQPSGY